MTAFSSFQTLECSLEQGVAQIVFRRPDKMNALDAQGWQELQAAFEEADADPAVRVVVLSGQGKHFCAGIDLGMLAGLQAEVGDSCHGRMREKMRQVILRLQASVNAIEQCRKPVIAAIHGGCIGGGVDIATACDMRYCTADAYFSVKEIDMGIVADLGTLQRLPRLVGEGLARELAFTGRPVPGPEAQAMRLANACLPDAEALRERVQAVAAAIAAKPPLVARGVKEVMNYSRDHSVADGLRYVATWNAATIFSDDLQQAMKAQMTKTAPQFRD